VTAWRVKPLSKPPKKPRVRAWKPKTRTGCSTCKQRRVKCDEARPHCSRCLKGGFRCDGYIEPEPTTSEIVRALDDADSTSSSGNSAATALTIRPSSWGGAALDAGEERALTYFSERTRAELASFTFTAAHFWEDIVPQVCRQNSTVRSVVIALASLHENKRRPGLPVDSQTNKLYLKHYSKAVQDLTRTDHIPSQDVVLMCCLLFMACENIRESAPGALLHMRYGLKVLREWRSKQGPRSNNPADSLTDIVHNYLEPIFARLEAQIVVVPLLEHEGPSFSHYDLNRKAPVIPKRFVNMHAARDCMHDVIQYLWFLYQSLQGPLQPSSPQYSLFLFNLSKWDTTFITSFPRHSDRAWSFWRTATTMRFHMKALFIAYQYEASGDPAWIDTKLSDLKAMVSDAEEILMEGKIPESQMTYGMDDIWNLDFCLSPPLAVVGLLSREHLLRRRAVHLLRIQHCWFEETDHYLACGIARIIDLIAEVEERLSSESASTATAAALAHLDSTSTSSPSGSSTSSTHSPGSDQQKTQAPRVTHRIRPLKAIMSEVGKIILEYSIPPHEPENVHRYALEWANWSPSPLPVIHLFPLGELVKHNNFQGMIRPKRDYCLCKNMGAPPEKMWHM
jgi:hypothetical protein